MIEQYITQRPADLERRTQRPHVVATVQNFSAAFKQPIHQLTDAGADALHAAGDGIVGLCFDQKMQVITLDRVVHHPEAVPDAGLAQRHSKPTHEPGLAQAWDAAAQPDRHVLWKAGDDAFALAVHHA